MRLNLASGTDLKDGWVNLDIVLRWPGTTRGCDVVWDARKDIIPFGDGTATEVYAGYLLLHLAPTHHDRVLADIRRVMSDNAVLVVGEVDMDVVMRRYLDDPTNHSYSELIWGEQGTIHGVDLSEFDKHCQGFTETSLKSLLTRAGFGSFSRINVHNAAVYYELTVSCSKA